MSNITEKAISYYTKEGFCCSESIWLAFADSDNLGLEERNIGCRLCSAFCGGTGAKELCGAVASVVLILGRYFGRIPGEERNDKLPLYTKEFIEAFREQFGGISCRELRPPGDDYKVKCSEYLKFAIEELEKLLDEGLEEEQEDC